MKKLRILGTIALCSVSIFMTGCAGGANGKSTGEIIDDTAIHTKVAAALINDPVVSSRSIDVDVNRGTVTLNGAVNGDAEKQKAEDIARGVNGVHAVQNNLVVRK